MVLRQTTGFVESLLSLMGLDWEVPNFSTLSRRKKSLTVRISCRGSDAPLHLLADSTVREVDGTWAGFGEFHPDVDRVLPGIYADDEERDLCLVAAGGSAGPDRDAGGAAPFDRPDAAREAGAAELVGHLGVVAADVHRNSENRQVAIVPVQHAIQIGPEARAGKGLLDNNFVNHAAFESFLSP